MPKALIVLLLLAGPTGVVLENDFVRVFRDSAPCATGAASCGERVFVALGSLEFNGQKMERGDIRVFQAGERYAPPEGGTYLEVVIKPGHPKANAPSASAPPPPGNKVLYDGSDITVFEERMEPGAYSPPHSHNQRLAIFLNKTQVQQWVDGKSEIRDEEPDVVIFRPAVVHASKDLGALPIRNILVEFKP
jgi:quercetin dioxygenase-like cupin family protein